MFGIYFGKYLVEEKLITPKQYDELIEQTKSGKVQMGLIAIEMGLMTEEQAYEVNQLQQTEDKRFGDLAIAQGYLTEEDVSDILVRQGDPYLLFIQALADTTGMSMEDIREEMVVYRKKRGLSLLDLEAIQSGDVDLITAVFVKHKALPTHFRDYIMLMSRNIVRFVDRFFYMGKIEEVEEVELSSLAVQRVVGGGHAFYTILSGTDAGISELAHGFARTAFEVYEKITCTLDAAKEFLNCNNGLYLTDLSKKQSGIDLDVPVTKETLTRVSSDGMFKIPYYVSDQELDLIISEDINFKIEEL